MPPSSVTGKQVSAIRLRYLSEVVAAGSMRAASDKLGVAPSSVSRQIAQLESELGAILLERGRRKISPTEAGAIAVRYYRRHRSEEETFLSEIDDIRGLRSGTINVALGEGFVCDTLMNVLNDFSHQYPGMQLKLQIGSTSGVMRMVAEDMAHIGLVFDAPNEADIRTRKSVSQAISAVAAPNHPLARQEIATLAEISKYPVALPPANFRIRELANSAAASEGIFLNPTITADSILILKSFALTGNGITLLPKLAVAKELEENSLHCVPISSSMLSSTRLQVILRVRRELPAGALRLLNMVEAMLREF